MTPVAMAGAVRIGSRLIGEGSRVFIIAEAGVNHNGSLELARELIEAAAEAGADAVKFQSFRASSLVTASAPKAAYQLRNTAAEESQYEMLERLELTRDHHRSLQEHARRHSVMFLSTPHDEESIDVLESLGVEAYKVGSGDVTNLPFLERVGSRGRPVLLSTGMSTLGEVDRAVGALRRNGDPPLVLLHCVSNYPADHRDVNLRAMHTLRDAFRVPVGYSDHTLGYEASVAAVAMGASVIEKHLTTDRSLPGPDHASSLEPAELAAMIQAIRNVESAVGDGLKAPVAAEMDTRMVARKSIVAAIDIPAGAILTEEMLAVRRPGTGIEPGERSTLIGLSTRRALRAGDVLSWEVFR